MAIITEEEDDHQEQQQHAPKPEPNKTPTPSSTQPASSSNNPFAFWFYFTLIVSIITASFISFESFSSRDAKSWFLSLPSELRQHYSKGRLVKVQTHPNRSPIEVFAVEHGRSVSENVVFVHGLGLSSYSFRGLSDSLSAKGVNVVAVDLPGHGFSDKSTTEIGERGRSDGLFGRFWEVYGEIKENGLFWAFDRIIETGQMPYEEIEARVSKQTITKPIEMGSDEIGSVLGQVIEALGLSPVHLVLHDTALTMTANWVLENSKSLRSVTLMDTSPRSSPALPSWVVEIPVIRELVLGSSFAFGRLIEKCCSGGIGEVDLDANRALLKSGDSRRVISEMGKRLNYSFDIVEWGSSDELKNVPVQVVWSKSWSEKWSEEGDRVAEALPRASFVKHSGGRWPQDDSTDHISKSIFQFISSLPATIRKTEEEPIPEHSQRTVDEAKNNGGSHHHGHDHGHEAGFMNAYGLDQGHAYGM